MAYVTRYVCGEQLEIPVGTLLERNPGCLSRLLDGTSFLKDLCEMIPKHQSAFDAALPALRAANDGILDETVPGVMQAVLEAELIWDDRIEGGARRIVELLLKTGINETNVIQQKWIAMVGPMPAQPEPFAPAVTAAMIQTLCMKIAFYKLIDVIRKADISLLSPKAKRACKADLSGTLTFSWDGIYDWRA
jgi:beta-glucosidase-like glycosyl hydrolase